jgi:hypothetical protein
VDDAGVFHVSVTYRFRPIIPLPQLISLLRPGSGGGDTVTLTRDSWFAVSDLTGS